jgi:FlaA1/EpsC-like NDP-sugar epimerase
MKSSLRFHSRTFASQQQTTPVVVMGLGRVGRVIARGVLRSRNLALVAAVDKDEALAGTPLHRSMEFRPTRR